MTITIEHASDTWVMTIPEATVELMAAQCDASKIEGGPAELVVQFIQRNLIDAVLLPSAPVPAESQAKIASLNATIADVQTQMAAEMAKAYGTSTTKNGSPVETGK